ARLGRADPRGEVTERGRPGRMQFNQRSVLETPAHAGEVPHVPEEPMRMIAQATTSRTAKHREVPRSPGVRILLRGPLRSFAVALLALLATPLGAATINANPADYSAKVAAL